MDGDVLTFQEQGLYDGLFLLGDVETGTWWNHLTGEALYGPLVGKTLPTANVLHTTVGQVLEQDAGAIIAISEHPRAQAQAERGGSLSRLLDMFREVPAMFPPTLGSEDDRRERMDIGIGIWDDQRNARYYSLSTVDGLGSAVLDTFSGRTVLVYYDPNAHSLQALFTDAQSVRWEDEVLHLSDGSRIEEGYLVDKDGSRLELERPLQVFTRWYGFSLTFPETDVYEG